MSLQCPFYLSGPVASLNLESIKGASKHYIIIDDSTVKIDFELLCALQFDAQKFTIRQSLRLNQIVDCGLWQ